MSYKKEDAEKILKRMQRSFKKSYIHESGIALDHANGTTELVYHINQKAFKEFAEGGEPEDTPQQVTLVLKNVTASDDKNPVLAEDIFVSATDSKGEDVLMSEVMSDVVIPNTLGTHTVEVTYTDGNIDDKPNTVTAKSTVKITTKLKQVTLVMKDHEIEEGTAVSLGDVFTSATGDDGKAVTADVALNGLTLPTNVGVHTLEHKYVGKDIRGEKNEAVSTSKLTIKEKVEVTPPDEVKESSAKASKTK